MRDKGRSYHPSGRNRKFGGILGWPLEHTLSPAIHNAAFRALGLDWVYLAFPVPPELLGSAVAGMRALGAELRTAGDDFDAAKAEARDGGSGLGSPRV